VLRIRSEAVKILAALNSTHNFVRTVVNDFAGLTVMVTFIYQAFILCFIQTYLVFSVVTWLESKNKHMGLFMIKNGLE
jgi:hypothetical protein